MYIAIMTVGKAKKEKSNYIIASKNYAWGMEAFKERQNSLNYYIT